MFRRKLTALDYHNPSGFDHAGKDLNKATIRNSNQGTRTIEHNRVSKTGQNVESAILNQ